MKTTFAFSVDFISRLNKTDKAPLINARINVNGQMNFHRYYEWYYQERKHGSYASLFEVC
jgi:hypothetical protein